MKSNFRKPNNQEIDSAANQLTKDIVEQYPDVPADHQIEIYQEMLNQINNGNPSICMLPDNYKYNILTWSNLIEDKEILETNCMKIIKEKNKIMSITKHVMMLKP